ncbi:MAG: helix-turn-helix domain-containing protein [Armatimonadetes bacterium]|nr:helix-turn-helix domain-containing protein [Armatimonadota bacterium]
MNHQKLDPKSIGLKIKWMREERKLSMRELASKANLAVSYISKIEAGNACPTVMSLQKILDAMNLDIYEFFLNKHDDDPSERIVFKRSRMALSNDDERVWYYAFPKHPDIRMELTYEEYQPHTKIIEKESYKGDMCGMVVSGELTLEVVNSGTFRAKAGDAFYVKAGKLHAGRNDSDDVLKIVAVLMV